MKPFRRRSRMLIVPSRIQPSGSGDYGYKANGAVCSDGTYIIKLDKEFKITQKKKAAE